MVTEKPRIIKHLIAELYGDIWIMNGRVLHRIETVELPDVELAALAVELAGLDDAVVTLRRPDGSSTSHRIRRRTSGL